MATRANKQYCPCSSPFSYSFCSLLLYLILRQGSRAPYSVCTSCSCWAPYKTISRHFAMPSRFSTPPSVGHWHFLIWLSSARNLLAPALRSLQKPWLTLASLISETLLACLVSWSPSLSDIPVPSCASSHYVENGAYREADLCRLSWMSPSSPAHVPSSTHPLLAVHLDHTLDCPTFVGFRIHALLCVGKMYLIVRGPRSTRGRYVVLLRLVKT